jgi:hypothetical protein
MVSGLSGTDTVTAVGGIATFAGLKYTGSAGSKTLTYTLNSSAITATDTFTIAAGAATQLALTTQAAGAVNGVAFTTQPVVTIQDASGNTVDSTATVSIATTGSVLGGTYSMAAVGGVADFTGKGVKLTGATGTYTLTYSSTGLSDATQLLNVTFGAAHHLTITRQAVGSENRTMFSTQPVVEIRDASNNLVADSSAQVSADMTGGTLTGVVLLNADHGVVTYTDLGKYGLVGTKSLVFSSSGLTQDSQTLELTHGAAYQIAVKTRMEIL